MNTRSEYMRLRAKGWTAANAWSAAKTRVAFEEAGGVICGETFKGCQPDLDSFDRDTALVCLTVGPDDVQYDDSYIDEDSFTERQKAHLKKELWARIERDGVWNLASWVRPNTDAPWEAVDSCCAFVGEDWKDSGIDTDLMRAALDELDKMRQDEADALASRATYAMVAHTSVNG